jgi:hypothetical protein
MEQHSAALTVPSTGSEPSALRPSFPIPHRHVQDPAHSSVFPSSGGRALGYLSFDATLYEMLAGSRGNCRSLEDLSPERHARLEDCQSLAFGRAFAGRDLSTGELSYGRRPAKDVGCCVRTLSNYHRLTSASRRDKSSQSSGRIFTLASAILNHRPRSISGISTSVPDRGGHSISQVLLRN